jgi:hypothetical protein
MCKGKSETMTNTTLIFLAFFVNFTAGSKKKRATEMIKPISLVNGSKDSETINMIMEVLDGRGCRTMSTKK